MIVRSRKLYNFEPFNAADTQLLLKKAHEPKHLDNVSLLLKYHSRLLKSPFLLPTTIIAAPQSVQTHSFEVPPIYLGIYSILLLRLHSIHEKLPYQMLLEILCI